MADSVLLHRLAHSAGDMRTSQMGVAVCGARRQDGATFTSKTARVTCVGCRDKIRAARERAAGALG